MPLSRVKHSVILVALLASSIVTGTVCDFALTPLRPENEASDVVTNLKNLYPAQSEAFILKKIENSPNPHKFFRAFVAHFYLHLDALESGPSTFRPLFNFKGVMAGDAHIENFGSLLNDSGKARFVLNDIDDAGVGPVVADFLRLSTSSSFANPNHSMKSLLKAYKQGLRNEDYSTSKPVEKLLKKSEEHGRTLDTKKVSSDGKRFLEKPNGSNLNSSTQISIQSELRRVLKTDITIDDAYITAKETGGSAGLTRYEILTTLNGEATWIELKQMAPESIFPLSHSAPLEAREKVRLALASIYNDHFDTAFNTVKIDGENYLLRYRWDGNQGVAIADLDDKDISKILDDEAYVLGRIHRRSLDNPEAYLQSIKDTDVADWEQFVDQLKQREENAYRLVRP